jgi:predicted MFS family arabinose efflux permease
VAGYRALLKDSAQRRLLLAYLPSEFADWLDYVAIVAMIAFVWKHGALELALLAVAFTLPYVTAGPLLAALVDRSDIKQVMLVTNVGRAIATFAMAAAPNVGILLLLVFVRATLDSAYNPARQAAIQAITPQPLLAAANGLQQGVTQSSKILGPALGGLLLSAMPAQQVFIVNGALSSLTVALILRLMIPRRTTLPARESLASRFTAGIAEFARNRKLLVVLVFAAAANFSFFLYDTQLALLTAIFGFDATVFGVSVAASGAGGLLGAALAGLMRPRRPLLLMVTAALVSCAVTIALAIAAIAGAGVHLFVYLGAMAFMGGSTVFMMVPYQTTIQTEAPPDRIARVSAAGEAVMIAALMSAPFLGSLIAATLGVPAAVLTGGTLVGLVGIGGLLWVFLRDRNPA